jgi:hypothetical protein
MENKNLWISIGAVIIIGIIIFSFINQNNNSDDINEQEMNVSEQELEQNNEQELIIENGQVPKFINLNLFLQDKSKVESGDCGITQQTTVTVPYTKRTADASLRFLLDNGGELSKYANYKDVRIENGIAKIELENSMTKDGQPISSLSSCEITHLESVLNDTLTQYSSINSIEIFSPEGKINF